MKIIMLKGIQGSGNGSTIMPYVDIRKLNDKEFVKKYKKAMPSVDRKSMGSLTEGAENVFNELAHRMVYSYGCKHAEFKIFVYRITMTNEDGFSVDYSWNDVKKRCNEIEVAYCPEINSAIWLKSGEYLTEFVEKSAKGESLLDSSHIREGVCVRVEGGLKPTIYKHKSFEFKVLEGIVKDTGVVDMEEAS
jgi:hypothetical protein